MKKLLSPLIPCAPAEAMPYCRDTLGLTVAPGSELVVSAGMAFPPCPCVETRGMITNHVI